MKESRMVISADTNGHSKLWYSEIPNRRGRITEEFINRHGLIVHNVAGQPNTFCRQDGLSSNIDVTMTTADIGEKLTNWTVNDLTDSDHRVICFNLLVKRPPPPRDSVKPRYNTKSALRRLGPL
ncbi:unnamed protein product [Macrosiphum euphorbiae]|nr:unnamed protein product [Macrosiphum euphorbiae]